MSKKIAPEVEKAMFKAASDMYRAAAKRAKKAGVEGYSVCGIDVETTEGLLKVAAALDQASDEIGKDRKMQKKKKSLKARAKKFGIVGIFGPNPEKAMDIIESDPELQKELKNLLEGA
jgi:hypothetical protein